MTTCFLPSNGPWVGPPVLHLKTLSLPLLTLDGNKRLKEYKIRGLSFTVPELVVTSHLEAIKHLMLNGHADRAAAHAMVYAPEYANRSIKLLNQFRDMGEAKLRAYNRALKSPSERHKLPRRGMRVVSKLRVIYRKYLEGETPSLSDIEKALGEFLDD